MAPHLVLASVLITWQSAAIEQKWLPLPDVNFLRYEVVRREIKLSPQQSKEILNGFETIKRNSDNQHALIKRTFGEANRAQPAPRKAIMDAYFRKEAAAKVERKRIENSIMATLTEVQRKRAKELQIQISGITIARHPDVRPLLSLSDAQARQLQKTQLRWMAETSKGPKGLTKVEYKKWSEPIRKKYVAEMEKFLTPNQRVKLKKLGGKPVDREKLLSSTYFLSSSREQGRR